MHVEGSGSAAGSVLLTRSVGSRPGLPSSRSWAAVVEAFAEGRPATICDVCDSELVAEVCVPAESLTTQLAAFLVKHTSGIITATIDDSIAARLAFPLLSPDFTREAGRFCVAVDGKSSSTGISAHDRAVTIRKMADASSTPADFNRPGHVIPVLTGGIFAITRWCRYDAAAAASKEAGLSGVVASAGLVHGVSTTTPEHVSEFGRLHDVPIAAACDALPE